MQLKSELIKNVELNNYSDKVFITFDTDWCSDFVLESVLEILSKYTIKATFFITHYTDLLNRMKKDVNIELGIHPNFNPLLYGYGNDDSDLDNIIRSCKELVPDAVSVRSHSVVHGAPILNKFIEYGLIFESNIFIPFTSGIELKPFRCLQDKIVRVPYFWEDDLHIYNGWDHKHILEKVLLSNKSIKVFDFHPIHVFLNTEDLSRYEECKMYANNYNELKRFVNENRYGIRNLLIDLISMLT